MASREVTSIATLRPFSGAWVQMECRWSPPKLFEEPKHHFQYGEYRTRLLRIDGFTRAGHMPNGLDALGEAALGNCK